MEKQFKSTKKVRTLNGFLRAVMSMTEDSGHYVYRGQEYASWPVASGAARRLNQNSSLVGIEDFHEYHVRLINEAKLCRHHAVNSTNDLTDLELLAELQHNGAATGLIDFTENCLVALWFACRATSADARDKDAAVYILNTSGEKYLAADNMFVEISYNDITENIQDILAFNTRNRPKSENPSDNQDSHEIVGLKKDVGKFWKWKPAATNPRMSAQGSIFVFGQPVIAPQYMHQIIIHNKSKPTIVQQLKILYGLALDSLFPDIQGFAESHSTTFGLRTNEIPDAHKSFGLLAYAVRYYQQGNLQDAIDLWTEIINTSDAPAENKASALINRGVAYGKRLPPKYIEEIADYTQVIDMSDALADQKFQALINRSCTYEKMVPPKHSEAIADATQVISTPDAPVQYKAQALIQRGLAYGYMEIPKYTKAIEDYTCILDTLDSPAEYKAHALINRGILYGMVKPPKYTEAIQDHTHVIDMPEATAENKIHALGSMGWNYYLRGDYQAAVKHSRQALEHDSSQIAARTNLGLALLCLDKADEALDEYRQIMDEKPSGKEQADALDDLRELKEKQPELAGVDEAIAILSQTEVDS